MVTDSMSQSVRVGSKVRFRGQIYTIKKIIPRESLSCAFEFEEEMHISEIPSEISIDRIEY